MKRLCRDMPCDLSVEPAKINIQCLSEHLRPLSVIIATPLKYAPKRRQHWLPALLDYCG